MNQDLTLSLERERYVPGEMVSARVEGDLNAVPAPLSVVAYYCEQTGSTFATPVTLVGDGLAHPATAHGQGRPLTLSLPDDAPPSFRWPGGRLWWALAIRSPEGVLAAAMFEVDPSPRPPLAREYVCEELLERGPTPRAGLRTRGRDETRSHDRPEGGPAGLDFRELWGSGGRGVLLAMAAFVIELASLAALIPILREEISILWGLVPALVLLLTAAAGWQPKILVFVVLAASLVGSTIVALIAVPESRGKLALAAAGLAGLLFVALLERVSPAARVATRLALACIGAGAVGFSLYLLARITALSPSASLIVIALLGALGAGALFGRVAADPIHRRFPGSDPDLLREAMPFLFLLWAVSIGLALFAVLAAG